jgi:hypothetical protein
MIISAELNDPLDPALSEAYLEVIAFENNVFNLIGTSDVINGSSVHLNTYVDDITPHNYYFYNNTFINCSAQERGGAIYIYKALTTFSFCSFLDCEVKANDMYGGCIHVEVETALEVGIHLIQLCAYHTIARPPTVIEIYAPPLTVNDQSACFSALCILPVERFNIQVDSSQGLCATNNNGVYRCKDLGDVFTNHPNQNQIQIAIANSNVLNPSVNINDKTIKIYGQNLPYSKSQLKTSIINGAFFEINAGTLLVEDLILQHTGIFVFFLITSGGCVRVTNCDVSNSNFVPQASFVETSSTAIQSEIYIRDTTFQNLSYSSSSPALKSSLIKIWNCKLLSFFNTNISDGLGSYDETSAFLVDASPSIDYPAFRLEFRNVNVDNITIAHRFDSSRGLIAIASTMTKVIVTVIDYFFEAIGLDSNTSEGGVFFLSGCEDVLFENVTFNSSGGSAIAGCVYIEKCNNSRFTNVDFNNITIKSDSSGGAVYAELSDWDLGVSGTIKFDGGSFKNCKAPNGKGGAVYLEFAQLNSQCPPVGFNEYRDQSFYFNATIFENNIATAGTSIFVEAYTIDDLFTVDNFKVKLELNDAGLKEYVAVDNCDENKTVQSIAVLVLHIGNTEGVIYVFGGNLQCPANMSEKVTPTCTSLAAALTGTNTTALTIEIISSADLNQAVTIYGNKVVIEPLQSEPGQYVILVIGLHGTIYVESGQLPFVSNRMSNEEQGGDVSLTRMDIRLAYKLGAMVNALAVVKNGIFSFVDCQFRPESGGSTQPERVSVYIADVMNSGKLVLKQCSIWSILVDGNVLIHALQESQVEIKVCTYVYTYMYTY